MVVEQLLEDRQLLVQQLVAIQEQRHELILVPLLVPMELGQRRERGVVLGFIIVPILFQIVWKQ